MAGGLTVTARSATVPIYAAAPRNRPGAILAFQPSAAAPARYGGGGGRDTPARPTVVPAGTHTLSGL